VIARVSAKDTYGADGGRTEAHQEPDRCGLSGSIGSQQCYHFAAAEGEREIIERHDAVRKPLGDLAE